MYTLLMTTFNYPIEARSDYRLLQFICTHFNINGWMLILSPEWNQTSVIYHPHFLSFYTEFNRFDWTTWVKVGVPDCQFTLSPARWHPTPLVRHFLPGRHFPPFLSGEKVNRTGKKTTCCVSSGLWVHSDHHSKHIDLSKCTDYSKGRIRATKTSRIPQSMVAAVRRHAQTKIMLRQQPKRTVVRQSVMDHNHRCRHHNLTDPGWCFTASRPTAAQRGLSLGSQTSKSCTKRSLTATTYQLRK